ncbi:MAG: aminotransferase class I/II-fold pyridoxal phosphate-dependent enzyme [Firmicutes bacterium]|nr:aminotransferase class I/II-fold pyridoxal phosphate-dependent enzyme [Bacillota bacterium]
MHTPLYTKIRELTGAYPLCMPGHKRRAHFLPNDILGLDITEIDGSDNLHAPSGVIAEAQALMAKLYKSGDCIFCVNGGSSGILAAILGTLGEGDTLLAVKNAHKSLQNALVLSGADAVYISPDISPCGFCLPITAEKIEEALNKLSDIKAVFIVSPTYEGYCADIKKIADCVHKYGKILIVDETHGAHFPFNAVFPKTASECGADISVQSWHKTLPVPNQCALINIVGGRVDAQKIRRAFSMVTTTSPSYIFMGLMDAVRGYYTAHPSLFDEYADNLISLRKRLSELKNIGLADSDIYDISKLTLLKNFEGETSYLEKRLKKAGFVLEMTAPSHIIAMTSICDDINMLERFADILLEADGTLTFSAYKDEKFDMPLLSDKINQRKIFYSDTVSVPLENSVGRTAAEHITPFPPDIPAILAGEKITARGIGAIKAYINAGAEILGLDNGMISVIR